MTDLMLIAEILRDLLLGANVNTLEKYAKDPGVQEAVDAFLGANDCDPFFKDE